MAGKTERRSADDARFFKLWRRFQNSTPKTYRKLSLRTFQAVHGPEFPDKAFDSLDSLRTWYQTILHAWISDSLSVADRWRGKLPSAENEHALLQVVLAAQNTGVRRIHRRILRDRDGRPRDLPIYSYEDLSRWCDLMFEVLKDEDEYVSNEREILTIRYDKGVAFRHDEEWKDIQERKGDKWAAEVAHGWMRHLCKGKPHKIEPDDELILVVWGSLGSKQSIREATVGLFIDAEDTTKKPHVDLFKDIVFQTWKSMRELGPVCQREPAVQNDTDVRRSLDAVKGFCRKVLAKKSEKHHDGDTPPKSQSSPNNATAFEQRITRKTILAIDLVGYSDICALLEEGLDVRTTAQLNDQIQSFINGALAATNLNTNETLVKTTGDGAILLFDNPRIAHRFAEAVHGATYKHNRKRTSAHGKRVFRSGAATGEISITRTATRVVDVAGLTIARAKRLEAKSTEGGLLVDEATYRGLQADQKTKYGPRITIAGKRDERFKGYLCQLNPGGSK